MALTPEIRVTKAAAQVAADSSVDVRVSKAAVQALVNYPAQELRASYGAFIPVAQRTVDLRVSKATFQVVCLGRLEYPYVLAWTATLDGHDYYFLQLHDETLVYDFHSERWYAWGSRDARLWRAQLGIDWNANVSSITMGLGGRRVSNILVGDYQYGALYFLDPELPEDDGPEGQEGLAFRRVVYGQLASTGHGHQAVAAVQLRGSAGFSSVSDMNVALYFSDDQGVNFNDAGDQLLVAGTYDVGVEWRSLGSFAGPGRLFKIEDHGALTRIDGLDTP